MGEPADVWAIEDRVRRVFTFKHRVLVSAAIDVNPCTNWPVLRDQLNHALDKESCSAVAVDLNMAGRRRKELHPTVIFTCSNEADEKKVITLLQSWKWLVHYEYFFWVVKASDLTLFAPVYARVEQPGLGALPVRCGAYEMTVGGVVWLDKKPYALTVGHAFREEDLLTTISVPESLKDIHPPEYPFQIKELEKLLHARPPPKIVHHVKDSRLDVIPDLAAPSRLTTSSNAALGNPIYNSWPSKQLRTFDWALIDIVENNYPSDITAVATDTEVDSGECSVITSSGAQPGFLSGRRSILRFGKARMTVRQITLERPLQIGDSGSWVTQNGKLSGHIVAGYQSIPWAYMMPMDGIFKDIEKKYHKNVSLTPSASGGFFKSVKKLLK
jgi:hypothetical protein